MISENDKGPIKQIDSYLESSKTFHLGMPLYRTYDLGIGTVKEKIYELMTTGGTIDAYCIWCRKESVFHASPSSRAKLRYTESH